MTNSQNILNHVIHHARRSPQATAILTPGQPSITYAQLLTSVVKIVELLLQMGLDKKHRVALILRDGPEMATLFLAASAIMTCAPLDPKYTFEEYKFYLLDLQVDAVIAEDGNTSAIQAAKDAGIKIIPLSLIQIMMTKDTAPPNREVNLTRYLAHDEDIALILRTSGTTARPKLVPLTHNHIVSSIRNITNSLQLGPTDRCLNTVPLFHVKGLIGALLASLSSGGSVVCSGGFEPGQFYESLKQFTPSWYTAVPTMHQAILAQGFRSSFISQPCPLRFIRSCSAALPSRTAKELEQLFNVPVIEGYGMTESASQMTVNPLPPGTRKIRSVGKAVGCEIAVIDPQGKFLASGLDGEIVARGASIISGYENNPDANQTSFHNGWLRTGDQGYLDSEGYLFITGRIKEMINRGGEKIWPLEVDEAILRHPAVMQVAAFAVPHPTLGEDLAVIIVKRSGQEVSEKEIRQFATDNLASFKVPSKVVFASEIPKGPTGKIQRVGLAENLGLILEHKNHAAQSYSFKHAENEIEGLIDNIWKEIFGAKHLNTDEDFFDLGGNSIHIAGIIARTLQHTGVLLSFEDFFNHSTVQEQALFIQQQLNTRNSEGPALEGMNT